MNEELLLAMTQPVPSLGQVAPAMPRHLIAVVDRALAFERQHRWPDARAMQNALRRVTDSLRSGLETPTFMAAAQPDTAPVLNGSIEHIDPRLTTSRPMVTRSPGRKKRRGVGLALVAFAATVAFGLGAAAFILWHVQRGSWFKADVPVAAAGESPQTATSTATLVTAAPPETSNATPPPASTTATQPVPTARTVPARPTPTAAAAAKPTAVKPKPAPTSEGTENPFDQRF